MPWANTRALVHSHVLDENRMQTSAPAPPPAEHHNNPLERTPVTTLAESSGDRCSRAPDSAAMGPGGPGGVEQKGTAGGHERQRRHRTLARGCRGPRGARGVGERTDPARKSMMPANRDGARAAVGSATASVMTPTATRSGRQRPPGVDASHPRGASALSFPAPA